MSLSDIKFDRDADSIKHRAMGEGVTYEQDGVLFSSGFVPLKILKERAPKDEFDDVSAAELRTRLRGGSNGESPPKKKTRADKQVSTVKVTSARQRADDKLEGFRTPDQPDHIQKALAENHAAIMAEEKD